MKDDFTNKYPFKAGVIKDRNGDLKKRWYVEFYVWDIALNKLARLVEYGNINRLKDAKARMNQAIIIKKEMDKKIVTGEYYINSTLLLEPNEIPEGKHTVKSAIELAFSTKEKDNASSTVTTNGCVKRALLKYFELKKLSHIPIQNLTRKQMSGFFKSLHTGRGNSTINLYRSVTVGVFNTLKNEELIIKENICTHVKILKTLEKAYYPYSDTQAQNIKNHLMAVDPQLWLFCSCIYYLLMRPKEINLIQIKHINLLERRLQIPAYIIHNGKKIKGSKNGRSEFVKIPNHFVKVLESLNLSQYPEDYFLFSYGNRPGAQYYSSRMFSRRYTRQTKCLNLSGDQTLYSWKHTGVCKLYKALKDIDIVRKQCRHIKIATTAIYLRNLGLYDCKEVEELYPEV